MHAVTEITCAGRRVAAMAAMLAGLGAPFAGCSTVPSRQWPAHDERVVLATYRVEGGQPVAVPVSGPELTILELASEPEPVGERFHDGRRWLEPPPGCKQLRVRCRYRVYAVGNAAPPEPAAVFPGAAVRQLPP